MDKLDCPRLHHGLKAWHKCHKRHDARMIPADGLLDRPCKCSIDPAFDLLLVRSVRLCSPEVEYQEPGLPPESEMLVNYWPVADVVPVDPHAAEAAAGSKHLSCLLLNLILTLIAAGLKASPTAKETSAAVVAAAAAAAAAGVKIVAFPVGSTQSAMDEQLMLLPLAEWLLVDALASCSQEFQC